MSTLAFSTLVSPSSDQIQELTDIINEAYYWSEYQMWKNDYLRIDPAEVAELLHRGEMIVMLYNDVIIATVTLKYLSKHIATFGLLAVAKQHLGKGYGSQLISFAEEKAKHTGHHLMECEIVRSYEVEMTHKDRLEEWYRKLGYKHIQTYELLERYPELVPSLIREGVCEVYQKEL